MEAKAGWETTSGLLYYLSVAEPVPKSFLQSACHVFGYALDTMRGEMTETLT